MKQHVAINYIISFFAGASGSYAFAPYGIDWLIFLSIGCFFYQLLYISDKKTAFIIGYSFGLGFFGFGINWLYISINLFGGVNLIGSYCITGVLILFHALYPALLAILVCSCLKTGSRLYIFCVAALWTIIEWSRTWVLTGFPWLAIGYTQSDTVLSAYAPVFGVYGISFTVSLISASLARSIYKLDKNTFFYAINIVIIIGLAFILNNIKWVQQKENTWKVALAQAGIPQEVKWKPEYRQIAIDLYKELSEDFWGYDLLVWPETALPFFYHDGKSTIDELSQKAIATNTEFLLGIPYSDPNTPDYYNSIISIGPSSGIYLKRHLVPFGEYLPLDALIRPLLHWLEIPMSDFSSGRQVKPIIKIKQEHIGLTICYEDVFGEEVIDALPDASILVNVSNDAWFGDSAAPHQHLQMARMRSIETGRYLLRATNNGVTAIIDNKGTIVERSPQFKAHALSAEVKLFQGSTPYAQFGNKTIVIISILLLLLYKGLPRKAV